jgi:crotonobetainyl-CoA:carnitine CoA-transferase CaiB-like acyl-CoA transferase
VEQGSGLPHTNGAADWAPCLQHVAYGDPLAGLVAAGAILAALHGRDRLGGAEIDLAQTACLFQFGADAIIAEQIAGEPVPRTWNRRARAEVCCVVACEEEDSWLAVIAADERALAGLSKALERDLAGADPGEIETEIAVWAALRDTGRAAEQLQRLGVPAAPVQRTSILTYDPQLLAGGFWDWMERRYVGRHMMCAAPFAFDGRRPALRRAAPTLGEHTEEVLAELKAQA